MAKFVDLTGQTFGKLTVLTRDGLTSSGKVTWGCRCFCGATAVVPTGHLKNGHTTTCGCTKARDLTGQRFGKLVALAPSGERCSGAVKWKCRCDCGVEKLIARGPLLKAEARSCGCYGRARSTTHGLSHTRAYKTYYQTMREAAKLQRTPPWADMEKIRQIYANCPEGYHVDHIVPLRGVKVSGLHIPENLQYLPASANRRKKNKFEPYIQMNSR